MIESLVVLCPMEWLEKLPTSQAQCQKQSFRVALESMVVEESRSRSVTQEIGASHLSAAHLNYLRDVQIKTEKIHTNAKQHLDLKLREITDYNPHDIVVQPPRH